MPGWVRIDEAIFHHPKMRKLGPVEMALFVAVICETKAQGWGGRLGSSFLDLAFWHDLLRYSDGTLEDIDNKFRLLEEIGLVKRDSNGITVTSWRDYQTDPTAAERQARYRGNVKAKTGTVKDHKVTSPPSRNESNGEGRRDEGKRDVGEVTPRNGNQQPGRHPVVAFILGCRGWEEWTEDQAEDSLMKLLPVVEPYGIDPIAVYESAWRDWPPGKSVRDKGGPHSYAMTAARRMIEARTKKNGSRTGMGDEPIGYNNLCTKP